MQSPPERPVYLLGESFGGVLALAVAEARPDLVDRIVLVNPATSFSRSLWPALGPFLPRVPKVIVYFSLQYLLHSLRCSFVEAVMGFVYSASFAAWHLIAFMPMAPSLSFRAFSHDLEHLIIM